MTAPRRARGENAKVRAAGQHSSRPIAAAPVPAVAYLGFGIMGLGISVVGPMGLALVGRLVAPEQRTAAIARAAVIGFSGFVLAPAVVGLVSGAFGLRAAFICVGLIGLTAPLLARTLRRVSRVAH